MRYNCTNSTYFQTIGNDKITVRWFLLTVKDKGLSRSHFKQWVVPEKIEYHHGTTSILKLWIVQKQPTKHMNFQTDWRRVTGESVIGIRNQSTYGKLVVAKINGVYCGRFVKLSRFKLQERRQRLNSIQRARENLLRAFDRVNDVTICSLRLVIGYKGKLLRKNQGQQASTSSPLLPQLSYLIRVSTYEYPTATFLFVQKNRYKWKAFTVIPTVSMKFSKWKWSSGTHFIILNWILFTSVETEGESVCCICE